MPCAYTFMPDKNKKHDNFHNLEFNYYFNIVELVLEKIKLVKLFCLLYF